MKKFIVAFFLLNMVTNSYAQAPWDLAYHAIPAVATIDTSEEIAQIAANAQSAMNQSKKILMTAKTDVTNLQSAVMSTYNNIKSGAILGATGNPSQATTSFCGEPLKDAKVKKIAKKFRKVFFTKKSNLLEDSKKAKERREKFYMDNLYIIYATLGILQQELETDIKPKLEEAKSCAEGKCKNSPAMPSSEEGGNNEVIYTYGELLNIFDSFVRHWENIVALKARLMAISAMPVVDFVVDEAAAAKKTSLNILEGHYILQSSEALAFAQLSYKKTIDTSLANVEASISSSKTEAMELVSDTVQFVSPAMNEDEHPLAAVQDKLEAVTDLTKTEGVVNEAVEVHNMIKELRSYRETAEGFKRIQDDYRKALEKLQYSEQCAIKYLGKYFSNPVKTWSGVSLGKNVQKHDLRKGISGWAVEAFETVKAAETSTITTDDVAQNSMTQEELDNLSDDPDFSKAEKAGQQSKSSLSKSKQEQNQEENRKSSLQAWQIGAEAAKMLGNNASSWGSPSNKQMVWTDTKNFYREYLRRKYENIRIYLKSYTRNDILALVVAKLKGEDQNIADTKYQKELAKINAETDEQLNNVVKQASASIKQKLQNSNNAITSLQKQRAALVAKMDKVSSSMKDNQNKVADIRAVAEEKSFQQIDNALNAKIVFPSASTSVSKVIGADGMKSQVVADKQVSEDSSEVKKLERKIKDDENELKALQAKLDKLDNDIAIAKLNEQESGATAFNESATIAEKLKTALAKQLTQKSDSFSGDVKKNLEIILQESAKNNPLINPVAMMAIAMEAADVSLNALYKKVDAILDRGYGQMLAMGDKLYSQSSHQQLIDIHNQMIAQIKALTLTYNAIGLLKVEGIVVYAKLLTADTSPETEGFFVGATAKARDMKAPYGLPNFDLPPVREVFHFDATDYKNVKPQVSGKTSGRAISASDFLNFGGDIPAIWQYILKDNAFIESKYNLKKALSSGCENVAFSRGGIMPCVVGNSSVVLDINGDGEYLTRNDISAASLPKCLLVTTKKGKPHHTFWDTKVKLSGNSTAILGNKDEPAPQNCQYSELGMLLEADENNNLAFKERAAEVYNLLLKNEDSKKLSDKQKNKIAAAQHAILSRNQIGDFLKQVENEKLMRQNLEEYKEKYEAQMKKLKERLKEYGFEPAKSFDLINDSDFKLAENKLKAIKKEKISSAKQKVSATDTKDNELAMEKAGVYNKVMGIMLKDSDSLMEVSILDSDDNDIEGRFKKAKADKSVVDKYKKGLKDAIDDYNDIEEPYCANY